jgi:hypothetical protein
MTTPQRYSSRPDGKMTLSEFICMIPEAQRSKLEDDIATLFDQGFGELSFFVVRGELDRWSVTVSTKVTNHL